MPDRPSASHLLLRLSPVALAIAAAVLYVWHVEGTNAFAMRNSVPMILVLLLAGWTLWRGQGRWTGAGWRRPLGTLGFAVPALGLSLYLHYGMATDLDGMYSDAVYPDELFRFLPLYTLVAGAIGFAIGWIAGRDL